MATRDYVQSIKDFLQSDGWKVSTTDVVEGVTVVAGMRSRGDRTDRQLTMVVDDAADGVSEKHVEFLLDAGAEQNVDELKLSATVDLAEGARRLCAEHDIAVLDRSTVMGAGADGPDPAADASMPSTDTAQSGQARSGEARDPPREQSQGPQRGRLSGSQQQPDDYTGQPRGDPNRGHPDEQPPQDPQAGPPPQDPQAGPPPRDPQAGPPPRGPDDFSGLPSEDDGYSRRKLLVYGGGVAVAGAAGFFVWESFFNNGPKAITKKFYNAVDQGNADRIEELLHPESPLRSDATALTEFARADLTVESAELVDKTEREGDQWATVAVSTTISVGGDSNAVEEAVTLRKAGGNWKVWTISSQNAGFLQTEAEQTGQQSSQQVTDRLEVVSTTGSVTDQGDTRAIATVDITVEKAPGASDIDLASATVSWIESGGTYTLVHSTADSTDADGQFGITAVEDPDGSVPVLNSPDDRMMMHFDPGEDDPGPSGGDTTTTDPNSFGDEPTEGESVTLEITTRSGGTTNTQLVVPESLSGKETVTL